MPDPSPEVRKHHVFQRIAALGVLLAAGVVALFVAFTLVVDRTSILDHLMRSSLPRLEEALGRPVSIAHARVHASRIAHEPAATPSIE